MDGPGTAALTQAAWPRAARAEVREFAPQPGAWRTFEVTTSVQVLDAKGLTQVWLPLPCVDRDFQQSLDSRWSGSAVSAQRVVDTASGAAMLHATFDAADSAPTLSVTSVVRTRDRATDWRAPVTASEDPAVLRRWTTPTELLPTDGIVQATAREAVGRATTDEDKVVRPARPHG